jgi:molybdenum cofactor guanylyltransferase
MITGLLLAGGRGSRMGEADKGLLPFRGTTLAKHVLARLRPQVDLVAINANRNLERYASFGAPLWSDDLAGFQGPLAGLAAGLRRCATPLLLTVPCDSPFLPLDLAARLVDELQRQQAMVAIAVSADETRPEDSDRRHATPAETGCGPASGALPEILGMRAHPVFALVRTRAALHLARYLATGGRRMGSWHAGLKVAQVPFDDAAAFRNLNTSEELQQHASP